MEKEKMVELLKELDIKNPESPSKKDILKLLELETNNKLDETLLKEYFQFQRGAVGVAFDALKSLATQHVSKDYINSINKRIETLDKEYLNTTSDEEREKNHQKVLELYKLIKEESNDQRDWIKTLTFGALKTLAVIGGIAVVTRNKEVGKKLVEEGIKVIKG